MTETAAPSVPLAGRLGDIAVLPRLLAWLARGDWSGAVNIRSGDVERRLWIADGRLSTATSTDPAESLLAMLVRDGVIDPAEIDKAAAHLGTDDRSHEFVTQLVRLHLLDRSVVAATERQRVIEIAETCLSLRTGTYDSESGAFRGERTDQALEIPQIIATALLGRWQEAWAEQVLGGRKAVHDLVPQALPDYEATGADESYDLTLLLVDGERTIEEVAEASPLPPDYALRFLAACHLLGCTRRLAVQRAAPAPQARPEESRAAAEAGAPGETDRPAAAAGAASSRDSPTRPRPRPLPQPESEGGSARWWLVVLLVVVVLAVVGYYGWKGWSALGDGGVAVSPEGEVGAAP